MKSREHPNKVFVISHLVICFFAWLLLYCPVDTKTTVYTIDSKLTEYSYNLTDEEPHPISVVDASGNLSKRYLSVEQHARHKVGDRIAFTDKVTIIHYTSPVSYLLGSISILSILYLVASLVTYLSRR